MALSQDFKDKFWLTAIDKCLWGIILALAGWRISHALETYKTEQTMAVEAMRIKENYLIALNNKKIEVLVHHLEVDSDFVVQVTQMCSAPKDDAAWNVVKRSAMTLDNGVELSRGLLDPTVANSLHKLTVASLDYLKFCQGQGGSLEEVSQRRQVALVEVQNAVSVASRTPLEARQNGGK